MPPLYMDHIKIFLLFLDLSTIFSLVLLGIELPMCVVVTSSQNTITGFLESSQVSDRFVLFLVTYQNIC